MKPTLLVLAAGMGSRYGGLKQIDPVGPNGQTIIDYSLYDALQSGFGKLVFVIRNDIEAPFRETVGARFEKHIAVEYGYQELDKLPPGFSTPVGRTKPWGTTHAILMAADTIRESFALINADDFYGAQSYRQLALHLQSRSTDAAMVGFTLCNTLSDFGSVARGICQVDKDDYLQSLAELTKIERDGSGAKHTNAHGQIIKLGGYEPVSMNFCGFTPEIFAQLQSQFEEFLKHDGGNLKSECYIPISVGELLTSGRMRAKVLRTDDSWFGVTYRQDRPHVVESIGKLVAAGHYSLNLWA